jgi:hypothetical protein
VLGRIGDRIALGGASVMPYELVDGAATAADALDSAVFFVVVLPDRVLVRIEADAAPEPAARAFAARLPDVPVEIEPVPRGMLLDLETLSRSPRVYKPVVLSDWRRPGRRILTVAEGMIEWPRPTWAEGRRWLGRLVRTERRRRRLARLLSE